MSKGLVCFDMDGVLVDYLSTWEWIYNKLNLSNEEAYDAFQEGLISEWEWIKYDLNLIRSALNENMTNDKLHELLEDCPKSQWLLSLKQKQESLRLSQRRSIPQTN